MDARQNCRAGAPTRAIHALPSPFFSLFPTFVVQSLLLDGSPLQSVHALLSPFFSLLPTFVSIHVHSWLKCIISVHSCPFVVQMFSYVSWFKMISLLLKDMSVIFQAISLERMDLSRRNGRIPTNEMPFSSV